MSGAFHSQLWYRVAPLKPALKPGLDIALHRYLCKPWFVIRDPVAATHHRFTAETYAIVGAMTGDATLEEIWQAACDRLGPRAPSQDDVVRLLIQLYQSDLLSVDLIPLTEELVLRMGKQRTQKRLKFLKNPMSIPLPLFDPDRLLEALAPLVRGAAGWVWMVAFLALTLSALIVLPASWDDLTAQGVREILALQNLALMAPVYIVVKAMHELAHGLALKRYGGECHEVGLMFLVFFPVPYVDASASAAFPSKRARALVGAAGIMAEVAMASAALFLWRAAEPGLLRDAAWNVMLISGFSTLAVNGNPLLKFDGYYVFSDLIEIPNLGQRANAWWGKVLKKRLLSTPTQDARRETPFEARVFFFYAPLAFVYRLAIMISISLYVASSYFVVGVALACMSVFQGLILPAFKVLKHFFTDLRLAEKRGRAAWIGGGVIALVALALFAVPMPLHHHVQGVVWLPESAYLRPETGGTVARVLAAPGTRVTAGQPILQLEDPDLVTRQKALAAQVAEARQTLRIAQVSDRTGIAIAAETLRQAETELARADEALAGLTLRAGLDGRVDLPPASDMVGQYLAQGSTAGHILPATTRSIRAVAPEHMAELIDRRYVSAEIRLALRPATQRAAVTRIVPALGRDLPSPVLARANGGQIATDPTTPDSPVDPLIVLDLDTDTPLPDAIFNGRVHVRLDFGTEPLGYRGWRALRRSFLRHFGDV